jgi:hypothetical protein
VSRMGKNSSFHFWDFLIGVQASVMPGIVMEDNIFRVSVRMNFMHLQFRCSDLAVQLNQRIDMALAIRCHCCCRLAALGLVLVSVSPLLKCLTHHLTVLSSTSCFAYTLFGCLWISVGLTSSVIRNSVTTLCFLCVL